MQPFRDTLVRTAGTQTGSVSDNTKLFTVAGKPEGATNLPNGSTLPSDQSFVVLALRVFTWFRNSIQRAMQVGAVPGPAVFPLPDGTNIHVRNGDFNFPFGGGPIAGAAFAAVLNGQAVGDANDVHRLSWQAEEQLLWSYGAGDKFSLTSMPLAA